MFWGPGRNAELLDIQDNLRSAFKPAFPKQGHIICLFTDAYDQFFVGILTQTHIRQNEAIIEGRNHEPLAFLGGQFNGSQKNLTNFEKEAYAIVEIFDRMDYLLSGGQPVHIFTDHGTLFYVFGRLGLNSKLAEICTLQGTQMGNFPLLI